MAKPGWLNGNSNIAYPFLRWSVNQPVGSPRTLLSLPNDVIVDFGCVITANGGFDQAVNLVWLDAITRAGDWFTFVFHTDATAMLGQPLVFTRHLADERYQYEDVESNNLDASTASLNSDASEEYCEEPLWYGWLLTGRLSSLAAWLPEDGTISAVTGAAVIEPALVQNLSNSYVSSINLANNDRTRATSPEDCPAIVWDYPTDVMFVNARCLLGDIRFLPGYNLSILQSAYQNALIFTAAVGAGEGQPCIEVPLFMGEAPPAGSNVLSGGPSCNQTLRSINGVGGPLLAITAGTGVVITDSPETNSILVNINMSGLSVCWSSQVSDVSESLED